MNEKPIVRQMLICDRVMADPDNPRKVNAYGLMVRVRSVDGRFPLLCRQICTYVVLTNGRGHGVAQVVAVQLDTGEIAWNTKPYVLDFGNNPLAIRAFSFEMRNCVFKAPGPYAVEFRYNGSAIAEQTLVVEGDES